MKILKRIFAQLPSLLLSFLLVVPSLRAQVVTPGIPAGTTTESTETNVADVANYKKMSLDELMNQEVTSVAKQPQTYAQAPAAIQVITGGQIHRSGASSIPEALRLADNLDVAQVSSSSYDISARGFNSAVGDKLLVLIDGRSVYTPLFSGVIWGMQDYLLEDIDRIEVISGPGGTMWGANAVNGVINITSKSAADTQGLYVEGGGGSWLEDFGGVRYGGTLASNVFYRVYGKYFDRGPEDFADGKSAHDEWNRGQGGFRIDADPLSPNVFTLQGDVYGGDIGTVPGGEGTASAEGNMGGANVLGRWTHTFSEDSDVSLQVYYDRTHLEAPFQSSGAIPAGPLVDDLDTADVDLQYRLEAGSWNNIVCGTGYRFTHDVDKEAPLVAFIPNTLDQNLYNVFAQDEIRLRDNLFFTLGTKVEHNDYTGFEFEPSARLQWNVTDKQMLWGAVSRAVRTPSRYDRELFEPSPAYGTFLGSSNSDFESETVIAYEAGYRAQLAKKVSGSVSAFYNNYDNLRSLNYSPTVLPLVFENNLQGDTYGFELSGDYQVLDWWRLHAGWDLLEEAIYVKPGRTDLYNGLNETADPKNQVFVRSSLDLPGRFELDPSFRWIDSVRNNNGGQAGSIPSYGEVDVRLAWHATKSVELSIVGQNLLHDRHAEAGFPGSAQEQIVRNIYGEITCHF